MHPDELAAFIPGDKVYLSHQRLSSTTSQLHYSAVSTSVKDLCIGVYIVSTETKIGTMAMITLMQAFPAFIEIQ